MAASRLSDGQKQELVERYRRGETAQSLSLVFGCSPNTVSRVVKSALDPEELAARKKQPRGRAAAGDADPPVVAALEHRPEMAAAPEEVHPEAEAVSAAPEAVSAALGVAVIEGPSAAQDAVEATDAHLAIDDADDFGDDGLDEGLDDGDEPELAGFPSASGSAPARSIGNPQPLHSDSLPASVYLLVDKTVELDIRPLRDFPELGALPDDEQDRQALMLYSNPRQAKRQCGRSQRVIKVPDSGVLERTSRYLVAQGITRLVLEGGDLFAVPGA